MMDLKQAIDYLQPVADSTPLAGYGAALAVAVDALREKQERMNAQPLTLDELRQMDGRPVWIGQESAWGIVNIDYNGEPFVTFYYEKVRCDYNIKKRGLACYSHEPVRRGRWIWKHRHKGGFRSRTGYDEWGNEVTIRTDERFEVDEPYCSECGKGNESVFLNYCPNCGAKMDLEG